MPKYLKVGKILNSRGLLGELKIRSLCENNATFLEIKKFYLGKELKSIDFMKFREFKKDILAFISGIKNAKSANELKGEYIYALREDIPIDEDKIFIKDLIGGQIIDVVTKKIYGTVVDILKNGITEIYHIKSDENNDYYMPIVEDVIVDSKLDEGKIFVNPIEGIFDAPN
ncbi:ribosome maturation factor RimM [Clostridia bacterium]|nr:ribosome maturation factor RimM [Clostridia bacterium]